MDICQAGERLCLACCEWEDRMGLSGERAEDSAKYLYTLRAARTRARCRPKKKRKIGAPHFPDNDNKI